jgi:hypothetical protein
VSDGPDGKWYAYTDSREQDKVLCLSREVASNAHEGTDPKLVDRKECRWRVRP